MTRLRSVLVVPDTHAPHHSVDAWELMLDVARDLRPDTIIHIGDLIDCMAVSFHSKDPARALGLKEEIDVACELRQQLDDLGAKRKVFCLGNHEFRLERYLKDKAPELFGMLDIAKLLRLEENGWEVIPYRHHERVGKVAATHEAGFSGRYAAFRTLELYQSSVITGHTHRLQYVVEGDAEGQPRLSAAFGWLGDVEHVEYAHQAKAKKDWSLGFGVGHTDTQTGHTWFVPVPILDGRCVVSGKLYKAPRRRQK